jgi:hypothetical protein
VDDNEPHFCITIYDISSKHGNIQGPCMNAQEISSQSEVEEIRSDPSDSRLVYATHAGELFGINLADKVRTQKNKCYL